MEYAPLPGGDQLVALSAALGSTVRFARRIEGGLGCTMDVLETGGGSRLVLRRYGRWRDGEDAAAFEFAALDAVRSAGVAAPEPVWVDREGIFSEQAIVIGHVAGAPLLRPEDPLDWAGQLADVVAQIHAVPPPRRLRPRARDGGAGVPPWVAQHPLGEVLWAARARLVGDEEAVFSHCDLWPGNTLWQGQRLAAVVDWEDAAPADPALDVAYCATDMRCQGMEGAADHFVARYRTVTGRELPNLLGWELDALSRPMPDIAQWLDAWHHMGATDLTAAEIRSRHAALVDRALGSV